MFSFFIPHTTWEVPRWWPFQHFYVHCFLTCSRQSVICFPSWVKVSETSMLVTAAPGEYLTNTGATFASAVATKVSLIYFNGKKKHTDVSGWRQATAVCAWWTFIYRLFYPYSDWFLEVWAFVPNLKLWSELELGHFIICELKFVPVQFQSEFTPCWLLYDRNKVAWRH